MPWRPAATPETIRSIRSRISWRWRPKSTPRGSAASAASFPSKRTSLRALTADTSDKDDFEMLAEEQLPFDPDTCPFPRHKHKGWKPKNQREQTWVCDICKFVLKIPPGPRARKRLVSNKDNHLALHTKEERQRVPRLNQAQGFLKPSASLPAAIQDWKCWLCGLALPHFSIKHAKEESIKLHFKECHPETDPEAAYHRRQREDPELRARMSKRGKHVGNLKREQAVAKLNELQGKGAHQLRYVDFLLDPFHDRRGASSSLLLTCFHCRGLGTPSDFREPCRGSEGRGRWKGKLLKLVGLKRGNLDIAVDAFGLQSPELPELFNAAPVSWRFFRKRPPSLADRIPSNYEKELREAKFARLLAQNIEPNPGPRSRRRSQGSLRQTLSLLSLNAGGTVGSWRLHNDLKLEKSRPDIILIQEGPEDDEKAKAWSSSMQQLGYRVRFSRDAFVLVKTCLRSRPLLDLNSNGGRAVFMQVNGSVVGSIYAAHHRDRDVFLRDLLDVVEGFASAKDWVIAGDFNLTPHECWLSDVLCAEGAHCVFPFGATTSRWDGNRLIDYGLTSVCGAHASFLSVRYSDHKALMLEVPWSSYDRVAVEVLKKAPKLFPASSDDVGRWSQAVSDAWTALSWSLDQAKHECETVLSAGLEARQQQVDELWTLWQGRFEQVLLSARDSIGSKGCLFQGPKRLALFSQVYADDESNQARVLRRLAARLHEFERRTVAGETSQFSGSRCSC